MLPHDRLFKKILNQALKKRKEKNACKGCYIKHCWKKLCIFEE